MSTTGTKEWAARNVNCFFGCSISMEPFLSDFKDRFRKMLGDKYERTD